MIRRTLILAQSEKGGCGKTTVADAIAATVRAGGRKLLVIDADDGNSGYLRRCGKGSAIPLSWRESAEALDGWMAQHLDDHEIVLIDCGANLIASGAPVNGFLGEFVLRIKQSGGEVIPVAIASTNAPGTDRLVREMRDAYGNFASVRLLHNDQDGSGAFPASLTTLGMTKAAFPHVSPGITAARLSVVAPLLAVLTNPPPAYRLAMALYAEAIGSFAASPAFADLFPGEAVAAITRLAENAPRPLHYLVRTLGRATDAALVANRTIAVSKRSLRQAVRAQQSETLIARAAIAMVGADDAYSAIEA